MKTSFFMTIGKTFSNSANELFSSRREKITSKYKVKGLIILALATILIAGCTAHRGMSHGSGSGAKGNGNQVNSSHTKH